MPRVANLKQQFSASKLDGFPLQDKTGMEYTQASIRTDAGHKEYNSSETDLYAFLQNEENECRANTTQDSQYEHGNVNKVSEMVKPDLKSRLGKGTTTPASVVGKPSSDDDWSSDDDNDDQESISSKEDPTQVVNNKTEGQTPRSVLKPSNNSVKSDFREKMHQILNEEEEESSDDEDDSSSKESVHDSNAEDQGSISKDKSSHTLPSAHEKIVAKSAAKAPVADNENIKKSRKTIAGGEIKKMHSEWNLTKNREPRGRSRRGSASGQEEVKYRKLLFGKVWPKMAKLKWTYVKGTEFYIDFHYLAPGVKGAVDGIVNETRFDDIDSFMKHVESNFPEILVDAKEELAEERPQPEKPKAQPAKEKTLSKKADKSKVKVTAKSAQQGQKRKAGPRALPPPKPVDIEDFKIPTHSWNTVWSILKEEYGWTHRNGKGLVSWVYVRQKGNQKNDDYFEEVDEILKFIEVHRAEYKSLYEQVYEEEKEIVQEEQEQIQPKPKKRKLETKKATSKSNKKTKPKVKQPSSTKLKKVKRKKDKFGIGKENWTTAWRILRSSYNWSYKPGNGLVSWYYIRTKGVKNGTINNDYFISTDDVIEYVRNHSSEYLDLFNELNGPDVDDTESDESSSESEHQRSEECSPQIHQTQTLGERPVEQKTGSLFAFLNIVLIGFKKESRLFGYLSESIKQEGGTIIGGVELSDDIEFKFLKEDSARGDKDIIFVSRPGALRFRGFLYPIALGIPCIHYSWVLDSCKKNKIVTWKDYVLPAGYSLLRNSYLFLQRTQTSGEFNLPVQLERHDRAFGSAQVSTKFADSRRSLWIRQLLQAAGADVISDAEYVDVDADEFGCLVLDPKDRTRIFGSDVATAKQLNCRVFNTYWVVETLLNQSLVKHSLSQIGESLLRNTWSRKRNNLYEKYRSEWPHPPYKEVQGIYKFACGPGGQRKGDLVFENDVVALKLPSKELTYREGSLMKELGLENLRFGQIIDCYDNKGEKRVSWKVLKVTKFVDEHGKVRPELVETEEHSNGPMELLLGRVLHLNRFSLKGKRYNSAKEESWQDTIFVKEQ